MPVAKHTIVFARIVPSELNIVTTENNNVIDLALGRQIREHTTGADIWQNHANYKHALAWDSFVQSFYGGGEGDFGVSQVAGRKLTMIGVSGEYANGVPQASSALTHLADRGRTDSNGTECSISGVSVLNDVIDSIVYDLGLPHESWDSCSYMNVVNQLQDVHTLQDCCRINGKLQQSCALSMSSLVHEIASNFDESMGHDANEDNSAVYNLYNNGLDRAIEMAMGGFIGRKALRDAHPHYLTNAGQLGSDGLGDADAIKTGAVSDAAAAAAQKFRMITPGSTNAENVQVQFAANHKMKAGDKVKLTFTVDVVDAANLAAGKALQASVDKLHNKVVTLAELATPVADNFMLKDADGNALTIDRSGAGGVALEVPNGKATMVASVDAPSIEQVEGAGLGGASLDGGADNDLNANQLHTLVLSVMFKNSTPGVRNVEFRLHFKVSMTHGNKTLVTLCDESRNPDHYALDGTQC